MSDCMVSQALYRLQTVGESCRERTAQRLISVLEECKSDRSGKRRDVSLCPFAPASFLWRETFASYEPGQLLRLQFLKTNPNCQFKNYDEYEKKVKIQDIDGAIETIRKIGTIKDISEMDSIPRGALEVSKAAF